MYLSERMSAESVSTQKLLYVGWSHAGGAEPSQRYAGTLLSRNHEIVRSEDFCVHQSAHIRSRAASVEAPPVGTGQNTSSNCCER